MASETIIVINFRNESAVRTLSHFTTLDSVLDFVVTKWPCCDKDNLRCSFNFDDVINCRIDNEEDYRLLLLLVGQSKCGVRLHIFVKEGSNGGQVVINPSSTDMVSAVNQRSDVKEGSNSGQVVINPSSTDIVSAVNQQSDVKEGSNSGQVVINPSSTSMVSAVNQQSDVNEASNSDQVVINPSSTDMVCAVNQQSDVKEGSYSGQVVINPSLTDMVSAVNQRSDVKEGSNGDQVVINPSSTDMVCAVNQQSNVTLCSPHPVSVLSDTQKYLLSSGWGNGLERVGQLFEGGAVEFRDILRKYALDRGFSFQYLHNTVKKITANCIYKKSRNCPWRVYAKVNDINGLMYLRGFVDEHTCGAPFQTDSTNKFNSAMVSRLFCDQVRSNPHMTAIDVVKIVNSSYGYDIPYHIAYKGLGKAKKECFGDESSSYNEIHHLFHCIRSEDPESRVDMDVHPETHAFERCFVAFGAWIYGLKFCRPMIFLDATFLSGKYKGILLAAMTKDGDQGLYLVAFAIVKLDDIENWTWFLNTLKPLILDRQFTFISDHHQGIINSVRSVFPDSYHSYCLLNLQSNLRDKLNGRRVKFWRERMVCLLQNCAYASTVPLYEKCYEDLIKEGDPRVLEFMESVPKECYANAYFRGRRYGEMTNNAAKSFKAMISSYCDLPVVELINSIRVEWIKKFSERRDASSSWTTPLVPRYQEKFVDLLKEGTTWKVFCSSSTVYEVNCPPSPLMIVDIDKRTCSCCMWQEEGFPCSHALCVLNSTQKIYLEYIEQFFHTSHYQSSYAKNIPVLSSLGQAREDGDGVFVSPPIAKRQPGRPKTKRMLSTQEIIGKNVRHCPS